MLSSIIRKLYHFKPKFESEIKVKKKKTKKIKKKSAVDELNEQLKENNDGDSDMDEGHTMTQMQAYQQRVNQMKHSGKRLFNSMQLVLGKGKANFSLATTGIIKMMLCLRILRSRKHLRNKS